MYIEQEMSKPGLDKSTQYSKVLEEIRKRETASNTQSIISGAKVRAVMEGRLNVSFEDIKVLAYPVLTHRIILNFDAITEGLTVESIIGTLLEDLKVV